MTARRGLVSLFCNMYHQGNVYLILGKNEGAEGGCDWVTDLGMCVCILLLRLSSVFFQKWLHLMDQMTLAVKTWMTKISRICAFYILS